MSNHPSSIAVFKYLVPVLVALVAMKYQTKNEDPFEARPINMWCFCIAICIYCLAKGRRNKIQSSVANYSPIIDHVILLFGVLASVSLISVLLPRIPELLTFAVILVVLIIVALNKHKRGCCWLCDGIANLVTYIPDILNWSTQSNIAAQPNPSPQVNASLDDLKIAYRKEAIKNHTVKGGFPEKMQFVLKLLMGRYRSAPSIYFLRASFGDGALEGQMVVEPQCVAFLMKFEYRILPVVWDESQEVCSARENRCLCCYGHGIELVLPKRAPKQALEDST
ncbi:unnamed protein product [Ilex paraguariensis]|uniref:Uncharacterized protein n=1 Tax=Ilex paraguariensis TaxID=185542 RepID=A0ABC8SQW4_9AQUA